MPNPDGGFIQVWDAPAFTGTHDYINGPRVYASLRDLPGRHAWSKRIRSVRVARGTSVVAYADERLHGARITLHGEQDYPSLPEDLDGKIESLDVACVPTE